MPHDVVSPFTLEGPAAKNRSDGGRGDSIALTRQDARLTP